MLWLNKKKKLVKEYKPKPIFNVKCWKGREMFMYTRVFKMKVRNEWLN